MESQTARESATWSVPPCPFAIDYAPRVLDDIRLAVMDAFFSLPRGGAEIGGVLLGRQGGGKVTITGYLPLECEHATGPSFNLSARDEANLSELLQSLAGQHPGQHAVGWYHSHTRSEIFLSASDLAIHNRYFPEPWQVALVLKPHTFQPMRGGFFFRQEDGAIHAESSYGEFTLTPLPPRTSPEVETAAPVLPVPPAAPVDTRVAPRQKTAGDIPEPAAADRDPDGNPIPEFLIVNEEHSWSRLKRILAVACGLALGCIAFQTRDLWLAPVPVGLRATEAQGQIQIHWNANASKVRNAPGGLLEILDGGDIPRAFALDQAHLQSGAFTYVRRSERVDMTLALDQPNGNKIRESTTFLGSPQAPEGSQDQALQNERDALAERVKALEADLLTQMTRNRELEKALAARGKNARKKRPEEQAPER